MTFSLHPDLVRDCIVIGDFPLCRVLLMNDSAYPWFVLVPRRDGISDTIDMPDADYTVMWRESLIFSDAIMKVFDGEKLNVAALGNMTPQLHVHHVVRYKSDPAWPGPIWGKQPMTPYDQNGIKQVHETLQKANIEGLTYS